MIAPQIYLFLWRLLLFFWIVENNNKCLSFFSVLFTWMTEWSYLTWPTFSKTILFLIPKLWLLLLSSSLIFHCENFRVESRGTEGEDEIDEETYNINNGNNNKVPQLNLKWIVIIIIINIWCTYGYVYINISCLWRFLSSLPKML